MFLSPLSRVRFLTKVPRVGEQTDKYGDWIRESVITYIIYALSGFITYLMNERIMTYLIHNFTYNDKVQFTSFLLTLEDA